MRYLCGAAVLLALVLDPAARGADLKSVKRTIAREPVYQTKSPRYGLLVFGPEAKFRFWLIRDGENLYVDRNGNGDLTEPGKRVKLPSAVNLTEPDGTTHTALVGRRPANGLWLMVNVGGKFRQFAGRNPDQPLQFAERPQDAPVIHFGGPLEFGFYEGPPTLVPGVTVELNVVLGTPGVGKGSFACVGCCNLPGKSCPQALVEFAPRVPGLPRPSARVLIDDD